MLKGGQKCWQMEDFIYKFLSPSCHRHHASVHDKGSTEVAGIDG